MKIRAIFSGLLQSTRNNNEKIIIFQIKKKGAYGNTEDTDAAVLKHRYLCTQTEN